MGFLDFFLPWRVSKRDRIGESGQTLIQMMIGVAIGAIVALGGASVLVFAIDQFQILVRKNQVEEDILWASYHSRTIMQQAVDLLTIRGTSVIPANPGNGMIRGEDRIGIYDSGTYASDGTWDTLAIFFREGGDEINGSRLFPTGVFFRRPNGRQSGRLAIDLGTAPGPLTGGGASLTFDGLTQVRLRVNSVAGENSPAREAVMTLSFRYWSSNRINDYNFCPAGPGCTPNLTGRTDRNFDVRIGFRNNELMATSLLGTGEKERLHGTMYYFPFRRPIGGP